MMSLRRVGVMALIAVVAVCVGGQAFAHLDGVGEVDGHAAHADLTGTPLDPAMETWVDGTVHDLMNGPIQVMNGEHWNCHACHFAEWEHTLSANADSGADLGDYVVQPGKPQPGPVSDKCLSCHDGTLNLNDYVDGLNDSGPMPAGHANFGTDLKHHHPVGVGWNDSATVQLVDVGELNRYDLDPQALLTDGLVSCYTCHDPHTYTQINNPENEVGTYSHVHEWKAFLKYDHLCFQCHERYQDDVNESAPRALRKVSPYANAHHFPERTDPDGEDRKSADGRPSIACDYCHDLTDDGPHDPGSPHNSPCVECHKRWEGLPGTSPADAGYRGHHNLEKTVGDVVAECGVCHADTGSTELSGSLFGTHETPGCDGCHLDPWSTPDPVAPLAATADDVSGVVGEEVTLAVDVTDGSDVSVTWDFGDGTPVQFPTNYDLVDGSGTVTATHVYAVAGVYDAVAVVANGDDDPIAVEITVTIGAVGGADTWDVDDLDDASVDYAITFGEQSNDGVFTSVDENGDVGFGIEDAGTIFWIEMVFTADSWSVGDVYFGNIDRTAGTISGVIITVDGAVEIFSAVPTP